MKISTCISIIFGTILATVLIPESSMSAAAQSSISNPRHQAQPIPYSEVGVITLKGLDSTKPLTQAEATFLEETIRKVLNEYHQENGFDFVTRSVTINKDMVIREGKEAIDHRPSLRGFNRNLLSNIEMCEYQKGPKKGQIIPGCEWDADFYHDGGCHYCENDDVPPMTRHPSAAPSENALENFLNNADNDDTPPMTRHPSAAPSENALENFFNNADDDDIPMMTRTPSMNPSSSPSNAPTKNPTGTPTKKPTGSLINVEIQRGPQKPSDDRETPEKQLCSELRKGRGRFRKAFGCALKGRRRNGRGGK